MLTDRDYELLSNYLNGALNAAERADLETRLKTEAELGRELDALRRTVALIKTLPDRKAPRNFTLKAHPAAQRWWFSPVLVSTLSAAAAVLLIGFGLLTLTSGQNAAPLSSLTSGQNVSALLPTDTQMQKSADGTTTTEEPIAPPSPAEAADQTQLSAGGEQQSGTGGGTLSHATGEAQQFGQIQSAPQTNSATTAGIAAAPPIQTTPTEGVADTVLAPSVQNNAVQEYNAQASEESSPTELDQAASAALQRTLDTPTLALSATPTLPPTDTPEPTLVPATKAAQTPSPSPVPTETLPLLSLGLGIVLLGVAILLYLRSRRNR